MISNVRTTIDRRLLTRRCVSCGFDGAAVNRPMPVTGPAARCPRCDRDLNPAPPRSYAEMEGLLGTPTLTQPREVVRIERDEEVRGERIVQRWLAFLFISMVGLLAIAYLAAAIMQV